MISTHHNTDLVIIFDRLHRKLYKQRHFLDRLYDDECKLINKIRVVSVKAVQKIYSHTSDSETTSAIYQICKALVDEIITQQQHLNQYYINLQPYSEAVNFFSFWIRNYIWISSYNDIEHLISTYPVKYESGNQCINRAKITSKQFNQLASLFLQRIDNIDNELATRLATLYNN